MHIDDLRKFAMLWLHKTEEVRADTAHYAKNITGDIYESGWISEMYGYSFGAAEVLHLLNSLFHVKIASCIMCVLFHVPMSLRSGYQEFKFIISSFVE